LLFEYAAGLIALHQELPGGFLALEEGTNDASARVIGVKYQIPTIAVDKPDAIPYLQRR
jgi:hypothetical protein